ncbi:MAG TPA: hypothetical protein VII23_21835 [Terriglobales bacterium]|jgi:hypothetical protein
MKSLLVVAVLLIRLTAFAQTQIPASGDIVQNLIVYGATVRVAKIDPAERAHTIKQLQAEQKRAKGKRTQEVAFLLASLGSDYEANRDYLVNVLRGCNSPRIKNGCDEDTAGFLIGLYRAGRKDVLKPLMIAGTGSYDGALAEMLGDFYANVLTTNATEFVDTIRPLPAARQNELCSEAGETDGSGMSPKTLAQVRKGLKAINDDLALRCLKQVNAANRR